ncbi:outer membrane beta-barrel protein [Pedobacter sp. P351]|uniref:type IX secretion/gliding motility protein PorT/SprT n=1 Tax=Pedobacter superstes TaxID=3133441 RepID=UPI0030B730A0
MKKRLQLIILFLSIGVCSFAQSGQGGNWGGGVDEQVFSPGFTFQYLSSEYKIYKKVDWQRPYPNPDVPGQFLTDSLKSISSPLSPGFGLGFIGAFRLGDNTDFRITPALVFLDRLINYEYADPEKFRQQKVATTTVEFPVGLKLKSDRRLNFRAYLLAGGKYSMDIISKKKTDDSGFALTEKFVKNQKNILSYEVGIGFDFYFEYFKLSPEFKLSNSINSVLKAEDHPYSSPLDKLYTRNFQFSLYFE